MAGWKLVGGPLDGGYVDLLDGVTVYHSHMLVDGKTFADIDPWVDGVPQFVETKLLTYTARRMGFQAANVYDKCPKGWSYAFKQAVTKYVGHRSSVEFRFMALQGMSDMNALVWLVFNGFYDPRDDVDYDRWLTRQRATSYPTT